MQDGSEIWAIHWTYDIHILKS
ncbi:protein of unknown function [Candidatus Promineifilum breve]|uniref:Uncharacterized protein n=1 Tax=Candidatus Promineifilum breve TaxID=1806508 RepID=A0A160T7L9_9CHLR|nr:protein of unknown function [Candidatus Promineifilum breve]